jgi:hypothetical protein
MSQQIDIAFVQQYAATVTHLAQQAPSKLRDAVRVKANVVGKSTHFERIGATSAYRIINRHSDTRYVDTPHSRRRLSLEDWGWADLVDKNDELRLLIDPTSDYVINAAKAMNRAIDSLIIAAFAGNSVSVDAADAATNVALQAPQLIVNGGTGMTVAKLRTANRLLNQADVEMEDRYLVMSPVAEEKLLADSQVTSMDFNSVRALVDGGLKSFMGFTIIKSTLLPLSGNIRSCYAWSKAGMGLGIGQDVDHNVDTLPGKNYSTQVFFRMSLAATRIEEARVVSIDIDESV